MARGVMQAGLIAVVALIVTFAGQATAELARHWYLGAALTQVDGGGVPERLLGGNADGVAIEGENRSRRGYRLLGGYHLDSHWAIEGAFVDLGSAETRIGGEGASAAEILDAAEDLQPQTARGLQITVHRRWQPMPRVRLSLGLGAWAWRESWSVSSGGESRDFTRNGVDPVAVAIAGFRRGQNWWLRLRWDRLRLEGGTVNGFALELTRAFR